MVVASGSEPEGRRFDSCPRRFGQASLAMEVTRTGEEAVLKTAGRKTCGFESHGLRSIKQTQSCGLAAKAPVLQTGDRRFESVQDYLASMIAPRSSARSRSESQRWHQPVWRGRCLQNILSEFESRWCLSNEDNDTAHRSSLEWTPPCHGGDHRFKSGMGRFVRQRPDVVRYANG